MTQSIPEHLHEEEIRPGQHFRLQFDIHYNGDDGISISDEVVTQPDISLTVRQLLVNHTPGVDSKDESKTPLYFDMEIPTLTDMTDVDGYRDHLKAQLKETNAFIKQEKADKAKLSEQEQSVKDKENGKKDSPDKDT